MFPRPFSLDNPDLRLVFTDMSTYSKAVLAAAMAPRQEDTALSTPMMTTEGSGKNRAELRVMLEGLSTNVELQ